MAATVTISNAAAHRLAATRRGARDRNAGHALPFGSRLNNTLALNRAVSVQKPHFHVRPLNMVE